MALLIEIVAGVIAAHKIYSFVWNHYRRNRSRKEVQSWDS